MKDVMDFMKSFDLHTIIVVGIAFWWLNSSFTSKFDILDEKIDKLDQRVCDLDRRVSRIEGAFAVKNFCVSYEKNDVKE